MVHRRHLIELRNVWKTYHMGGKPLNVLQGINLDIHEGDFVSIQGPSGSGKSTLMYLLGCLDLPSRGQVFLDGKDISKLSESNLAKIRGQKIGFVFQSFNLVQTLSALENTTLPTFFQNIPEAESTKKAMELLRLVGLGERALHHPNQLSGGEQQRIAIARALINDPPIILADEPTGNLDSKTGHEIMKLLTELHHKYNKTIIVVTHDPDIAHHAEKIVNIIDGQIAHDHQLTRKFVWAKNNK